MLLRGYDGQQRLPGLRDLIERIRQQRQRRLERHDLDSVMDDIEERLKDIVETERSGIDRRLQEAADELAQDSARSDEFSAAMQVLERRAEQSREVLDNLSESPAGAVRQLKDYDFVDSEAHRKFQELLDMLSQGMMDSFVQNMREQLQQMSPEQKQRLNEMLRALSQMLTQRAMGLEPDFDTFMLASTSYLMDFVDKMTQINRGRAFFTTPAELGSYVMVDYLNARRKRVGA